MHIFDQFQTLPFYPQRKLNSTDSHRHFFSGFEGVVTEKEYQNMLKKKWLGRTTPLDFHGYNSYPDYWPFWSCESYTYVTSMLALAKFSNTVEEVNTTY